MLFALLTCLAGLGWAAAATTTVATATTTTATTTTATTTTATTTTATTATTTGPTTTTATTFPWNTTDYTGMSSTLQGLSQNDIQTVVDDLNNASKCQAMTIPTDPKSTVEVKGSVLWHSFLLGVSDYNAFTQDFINCSARVLEKAGAKFLVSYGVKSEDVTSFVNAYSSSRRLLAGRRLADANTQATNAVSNPRVDRYHGRNIALGVVLGVGVGGAALGVGIACGIGLCAPQQAPTPAPTPAITPAPTLSPAGAAAAAAGAAPAPVETAESSGGGFPWWGWLLLALCLLAACAAAAFFLLKKPKKKRAVTRKRAVDPVAEPSAEPRAVEEAPLMMPYYTPTYTTPSYTIAPAGATTYVSPPTVATTYAAPQISYVAPGGYVPSGYM